MPRATALLESIKSALQAGRWPMQERALAGMVRTELRRMQASIGEPVTPGSEIPEETTRLMRAAFCSRPVVLTAIDHVRRHPLARMAGSDGEVLASSEDALRLCDRITYPWLANEYESQPLRTVAQSPYDNIRGLNRKLLPTNEARLARCEHRFGLPTVTDRVVMAMAALVLQPAAARRLQGGDAGHETSHAALSALNALLVRSQGVGLVLPIEVDWAAACATGKGASAVPLLLRAPSSGGQLQLPAGFERLRKQWARQRLLEGGLVRVDPEGAPREVCALSRVLADTWMAGLEEAVAEQLHEQLGYSARDIQVVRWSGHAAVFLRHEEAQSAAKIAIGNFLSARGLRECPTVEERRPKAAPGLRRTSWLGFDVLHMPEAAATAAEEPRQRGRRLTAVAQALVSKIRLGKPAVVFRPSTAAATVVRQRMKHISRARESLSPTDLAALLGRHLHSWASHFAYGTCSDELRRMQSYVMHDFMGKYLYRKFGKSSAAERHRVEIALREEVDLRPRGGWDTADAAPCWHDSLFRATRETLHRRPSNEDAAAIPSPRPTGYYRGVARRREERRSERRAW